VAAAALEVESPAVKARNVKAIADKVTAKHLRDMAELLCIYEDLARPADAF
jgi:hypothetical protein